MLLTALVAGTSNFILVGKSVGVFCTVKSFDHVMWKKIKNLSGD